MKGSALGLMMFTIHAFLL